MLVKVSHALRITYDRNHVEVYIKLMDEVITKSSAMKRTLDENKLRPVVHSHSLRLKKVEFPLTQTLFSIHCDVILTSEI